MRNKSLSNFVTTMHTFLDDLATCFPNQQHTIREYRTLLDTDPQACAKQFVQTLQPFADAIVHGNTSVYTDNTMIIGGDLDICDIWSHATQDQRESIHAYIHPLLIMASTLTTLPANVLDTIDTLTQSYLSGNTSLEALMETEMDCFDEGAMADLCRLMLPTMEMDFIGPKKMSS